MKSVSHAGMIIAALFLSLFLTACSGGSGSSSPAAGQTSTAPLLEGVVASGNPLSGTVYVTDSSYPSKKVSAAINQDGTFSISVAGLTPPLLVKAVGTVVGNLVTLYSFATAPGRVQVNPLTDLLVAAASGAQQRADLFGLYSSHNRASLVTIANRLPQLAPQFRTALQPLLALYGADTADPFSTAYRVDHQGLDGLFDDVAITIANGSVTITNKGNGAIIYAGTLDSVGTGTLTTASLPTPTVYARPGNARLTLQLNGLAAGTQVKRLKTTIRLPLGVTVQQLNDPITQLPSGTAVVNTASPSGSATGAAVYPLPSLSATNNELTLELSSLDGFGNGEFLTLRCIVSYAALTTVTADAFTIVKTELYGDIYKQQKITSGGISSATLVFPVTEGKKVYDGLCSGCHTLGTTDTVGRPSLLNKASLVPAKFTSGHRGVYIATQQIEDLQAFLVDQSK